MKNIVKMTCVAAVAWIISSYFNGSFIEASYSKLPREKVLIVQKVAKKFREERNRDWQCTIDGKKATLEGLMLGKVANESAYGTKGAGARSNNWGNIHGDLVGKSNGVIRADNTSKFPTFKTPEDGLENLAQWLKNRGCSMSWNTSWNYVKGPNAARTEKNITDINNYHSRVVSVVKAYDDNKDLFLVDTAETRAQWDSLNNISTKKTVKEGCFLVKKIRKADYIQIDEGGEMKKRIDVGQEDGKLMDVFNCYE